jgi:hypothetical protein
MKGEDSMRQRNQPALAFKGGKEIDRPFIPLPTHADSTILFAGDPSQVSAGFALALRLMGFEVPVNVSEPASPKGIED